jgi:hypothetical protein
VLHFAVIVIASDYSFGELSAKLTLFAYFLAMIFTRSAIFIM